MATTSKRDRLRSAVNKPRARRTPAERQKLGQGLLSKKDVKPLLKIMFVMEAQDIDWLNKVVADLKPERRRTSKSEMMRLGVAIMKKMDPDELRQHLRDLD
jgi:hypothetical protein